jgi:hypothetical protein
MLRARGLDTKHASDVSATMRVASVNSDRPEIFKRLSWNALFELSSPKMSKSVRTALEVKVIAGESVTATQTVDASKAAASSGIPIGRRRGWRHEQYEAILPQSKRQTSLELHQK